LNSRFSNLARFALRPSFSLIALRAGGRRTWQSGGSDRPRFARGTLLSDRPSQPLRPCGAGATGRAIDATLTWHTWQSLLAFEEPDRSVGRVRGFDGCLFSLGHMDFIVSDFRECFAVSLVVQRYRFGVTFNPEKGADAYGDYHQNCQRGGEAICGHGLVPPVFSSIRSRSMFANLIELDW
jgi:hypothetical protein